MLDTGLPHINANQIGPNPNKKSPTREKSPKRKRMVNRTNKQPKSIQPDPSLKSKILAKSAKLTEDGVIKQPLDELKSVQKIKDKQVLCQELLLSGFVDSYVEFFHLTHRSDEQTQTPMTIEELEFVKKCLSDSEIAHRQSNSENMYLAYEKIANHFAGREDPSTAIYFFEKCFEMAEEMGNPSREGESNHYLGMMFEKLLDTTAAIRFHDLHLNVARDTGDDEGVMLASRHLTHLYRIQAEEHQEAGQLQKSVETLSRCLQAALAADDRKAEGYANYKLGVTLTALGDAKSSVPYLDNFLRISQQLQDRVGEGDAEAALGRCFRMLKENAKAIRHFEAHLEIATENGRKDAQQKAFVELGGIYCELEDFDKAIYYHERNYQLTRSQAHKDLDSVRTSLGMARGDFLLSDYLRVVKEDVSALVQWQCTRAPFTNEKS